MSQPSFDSACSPGVKALLASRLASATSGVIVAVFPGVSLCLETEEVGPRDFPGTSELQPSAQAKRSIAMISAVSTPSTAIATPATIRRIVSPPR
jgi:hypothetical protein